MPSLDSNLDYAPQVGKCGTNIGAEVNPRHFREAALAMINLMLPLPGLSPISALSACVGHHTSITTNKNLGGRRTIIPFMSLCEPLTKSEPFLGIAPLNKVRFA